MTYNFTDDPAPVLPTEFDATGALVLQDGTPQGNLLTEDFTASSVSVSITPPLGWVLDEVEWANGGSGTFSVPAPGVEDSHPFTYRVSQNGTRLTDNGHFKIKKQGNGGG